MRDDFDRKFDRGMKALGVVWIVWAAISLSILGGVIYVGVHFIRKWW